MQKLLGNMQSKGMEDKAESWVAKDVNQPITPQELQQVVPKEEIDQLAQQTGATPEQAEEVLAQALPQVVDKVTPEGQLPQQAQVDEMLGQLFGQK